MRYLLLLALVACGDDHGSTVTPDAAPAQFCDGTPHEVGTGIINAIAVDASGRLLVVGTQFTPQPQSLFVRRLLPSGEPDTTFGTDGLVTRPGAVTDGHAVLPRADGTILVGAGIENGSGLEPIVYALDTNGQPTGFELTDTEATSSVVDQIFAQGTSVIIGGDGILKRVTAAGALDPTFGSSGENYTGPGVAISDSGFAVAVTQLSEVETFRMMPDGTDITGSAAMVDADVHAIAAVMSRNDRITFVGDVKTAAFGTYDLMVGRVLADNTFDTSSYPPNGYAVVQGVRPARAAVERDDGSILAAIDGGALVRVSPTGTLDQMHPFDTANLTSVADWGGHDTVAGTLSGGHAIVACF
jgi:hypothetical protein